MDIILSKPLYLLLKQDCATNLPKLMIAIPETTFLQIFEQAISRWDKSTPANKRQTMTSYTNHDIQKKAHHEK